MKAAIFHGPHKLLTIEDVDIDKPIGREVLVRTVASGVCHSDLHFVDGYYPFPTPAILGHEAAWTLGFPPSGRWSNRFRKRYFGPAPRHRRPRAARCDACRRVSRDGTSDRPTCRCRGREVELRRPFSLYSEVALADRSEVLRRAV